MAALDDLTTAYNQVAANLKAITLNPKPSYSLDGETYSWAEYYQMLTNQSLALESMIQRAGGQFEFRTQALS